MNVIHFRYIIPFVTSHTPNFMNVIHFRYIIPFVTSPTPNFMNVIHFRYIIPFYYLKCIKVSILVTNGIILLTL